MAITRRVLFIVLGVLVAGAAGAVTLVLALGGSNVPAPSAAPNVPAVTITVGAAGADVASFTDPSMTGQVGAMSPKSSVSSKQVTVPADSTVGVSLSGTAGYPISRCWISDASDRVTYTEGTTSCTYRVGR